MTTLMLIGDSITAGFDTAGSFPEDRVINKGVDGDSTVECLARIGEEWFLTPVDAVCICIGTNDIAQGRTDDAILATIERIVGRTLCARTIGSRSSMRGCVSVRRRSDARSSTCIPASRTTPAG